MAEDDNADFMEEFEAERIHWAVQEQDLDKVKELLASNVDINSFDQMGWTALHHAARDSNLEMMSFLLEHGADVNAQDLSQNEDTALGAVAAKCSFEVAKLLIDSGADPLRVGAIRLSALDHAKMRKDPEGKRVYELLLAASELRK